MLKDPEDVEVQCFSRSGALPSELLLGPLQWMGWLTYLGLNHFMELQAAVTVAAIFLGDSWLAPMLGQAYGRHHYHRVPLLGHLQGQLAAVGAAHRAGLWEHTHGQHIDEGFMFVPRLVQ